LYLYTDMKRDRENREWLNDYMSLKQVNPNNPFSVPEGYFDSLDEQVLSKIRLDELKSSAPGPGFTIPDGYFDELTSNIQSRIIIEETAGKEETGFLVPDGYFDELQQQIQSRIFIEESLNEQPAGFNVPEGYFEQLTENILSKTTAQQVVPQKRGIVRRLIVSAAFKYAAAACLVIAIGGTIFLSQNSTNPADAHNNSFLHKSLAAIPVDDIQNYLQSHLDVSDTHALMDETKQADADNLTNDLRDALDSTSQ
jgi:hypothetical protein